MDGYALRRVKALLDKFADRENQVEREGELAGERVGELPASADF